MKTILGHYQSHTSGCCLNCGGLILEPGKAYGYTGKICYCAQKYSTPFQQQQNPQIGQQGWICPKCNSSNSPFKDKCGC